MAESREGPVDAFGAQTQPYLCLPSSLNQNVPSPFTLMLGQEWRVKDSSSVSVRAWHGLKRQGGFRLTAGKWSGIWLEGTMGGSWRLSGTELGRVSQDDLEQAGVEGGPVSLYPKADNYNLSPNGVPLLSPKLSL